MQLKCNDNLKIIVVLSDTRTILQIITYNNRDRD